MSSARYKGVNAKDACGCTALHHASRQGLIGVAFGRVKKQCPRCDEYDVVAPRSQSESHRFHRHCNFGKRRRELRLGEKSNGLDRGDQHECCCCCRCWWSRRGQQLRVALVGRGDQALAHLECTRANEFCSANSFRILLALARVWISGAAEDFDTGSVSGAQPFTMQSRRHDDFSDAGAVVLGEALPHIKGLRCSLL